jgi:hypothetical protein
MSRMGSVHLVSIFSYWLVSNEYMHTVPSSEPVKKYSFCGEIQRRIPWPPRQLETYRGCDSQVVLLAVIDVRRFAVRSRCIYPYDIVRACRDETPPIWSVGKEGRAGGVFDGMFSVSFKTPRDLAYVLVGPVLYAEQRPP